MNKKATLTCCLYFLFSCTLIAQTAKEEKRRLLKTYYELVRVKSACERTPSVEQEKDCQKIDRQLLAEVDSVAEKLALQVAHFDIWWKFTGFYGRYGQDEKAEQSAVNALAIIEKARVTGDTLTASKFYERSLLRFLVNHTIRRQNFTAAAEYYKAFTQLPPLGGCGTKSPFKPYWRNENYTKFLITAGLEQYEQAYDLIKNNSFPTTITHENFKEMWLQFYVQTVSHQFSSQVIAAELERAHQELQIRSNYVDAQRERYQSDLYNEKIPVDSKFAGAYIAYGQTTFFGNTIYVLLTEEIREQNFFHEYCMGQGGESFIEKAIKETFLYSDFYQLLNAID